MRRRRRSSSGGGGGGPLPSFTYAWTYVWEDFDSGGAAAHPRVHTTPQ